MYIYIYKYIYIYIYINDVWYFIIIFKLNIHNFQLQSFYYYNFVGLQFYEG